MGSCAMLVYYPTPEDNRATYLPQKLLIVPTGSTWSENNSPWLEFNDHAELIQVYLIEILSSK